MTHAPGDLAWQGEELDLDAYLARIGYGGDRTPTLATLRELQRAHVTSIPFENLEIVLGRPVVLGVKALQDKMVHRRRGGYCFEHIELFAAALERLGFTFTALSARVSMGIEKLLPATHALLRVEVEGGTWLCDVGFGAGPLEPLRFVDGAESAQGGWAFRLERIATSMSGLPVERWALHQHGPEGWLLRHSFALAPAYRIDYEVGSHFVSTHPRSPFTGRAYAQYLDAETKHELDDTRLKTVHADGRADPVRHRDLEPGEVPDALAELFGIELDAEDTARLVAELTRTSRDPRG
ncbi:arylamine N-acetyltransferase [Actinomadura viridis]|uniref:N-hydroxyarylamine O-acetyltransferase n=1 Tax=Actinomadura viridis TaxID=58110 RepID=A0A931DLT9_9ACTN|nr:arylamine N-acetyltransferase [Actinomadura viridis]MBG6091882.1 N-hydroxyarylamine O-acetyltransferase [Actinomadura viridis]